MCCDSTLKTAALRFQVARNNMEIRFHGRLHCNTFGNDCKQHTRPANAFGTSCTGDRHRRSSHCTPNIKQQLANNQSWHTLKTIRFEAAVAVRRAPDRIPAQVLHNFAGEGRPMLAEVENCDCVTARVTDFGSRLPSFCPFLLPSIHLSGFP